MNQVDFSFLDRFTSSSDLRLVKSYKNVCLRGQNQNRNRKNGEYYEGHHILPESWGGKGDTRSKHPNITQLTAKEHLFVHWVLCKLFPEDNKMWLALQFLINGSTYNLKNHTEISYIKLCKRYEEARLRCAEIQKGKKDSDETKNKKKNKLIGRPVSEETRQKMSLSQKGKKKNRKKPYKPHTQESKQKISQTKIELFKKNPEIWKKGTETLKKNNKLYPERIERARQKSIEQFNDPLQRQKQRDRYGISQEKYENILTDIRNGLGLTKTMIKYGIGETSYYRYKKIILKEQETPLP